MVVQHNQPGSTDQSVDSQLLYHRTHRPRQVDAWPTASVQLSGIVPEREMRDRFLDRMDIEQERGITIKSQAVRVPWTFDGTEYTLGMIDTPGHVDFTYEVSRALAACEGAVLLVDATQGIEAQTLSNLYMAIDHRSGHHPRAQQNRPAVRRTGQACRGDRRSDRLRAERRAARLRQNRRRRGRPARPDRHGRARPARRPRCPRPRADLRFRLRLLPRHRHLHPYGGRRTARPRKGPHDGHWHDP